MDISPNYLSVSTLKYFFTAAYVCREVSAICYCTEWLPSLVRTEFYTSTNSGNQGITKNDHTTLRAISLPVSFEFLICTELKSPQYKLDPEIVCLVLQASTKTIGWIKQNSNTGNKKTSPEKIKPVVPENEGAKQLKWKWILRFWWNLHLSMCKDTQPACVDHEECDPRRPSDVIHDADIYP